MVWIWDLKRDCLTANLVFVTPVISLSWSPVKDSLTILTSNQTLYFWEDGSIVWSLLPNSIIEIDIPNRNCGITISGMESQRKRLSAYWWR